MRRAKRDLNNVERAASLIGGATLLLVGLKRPSWVGLLMAIAGGALVHTGATGYCVAYSALGRTGNGTSIFDDGNVARDVHVEKSILINRDAAELYSYWREFENLPAIMQHLESVTTFDNQKSHWVAVGPAGKKFEWDAEIYNEKPDELIAWRSLPGANIVNAGSVHFERGAFGRGTKVKVVLNYNIPGGKLTALFAKPFGTEPGQLIEDDLRRFKQLMETGELATVQGQPTGTATDGAAGRKPNLRAAALPREVTRGREQTQIA
ncbi:MAG TPA: SRPBCC family protein [Pyrinomonadaceae bacterium]|nr:SRPBCC family protein [Pyrinomonadaceae bacterium]